MSHMRAMPEASRDSWSRAETEVEAPAMEERRIAEESGNVMGRWAR